MNLSQPMLVCIENEEMRFLLRAMLTKNGFYHVLEASTSTEALRVIREEKKNIFLLLDLDLVSAEVLAVLEKKKEFLVFNHTDDKKTPLMAARLGTHNMLSYPFSGDRLVKKISTLS